MILCEVNPGHCHIDLNYYTTADSYHVDPLEGEPNLLYWYTKEELSKVKNAPHDVIVMANEALELLSKIYRILNTLRDKKIIWRFHMENLEIRRFDNNDATTVSKMICRNFLEVNIKDYSKEEMEYLSEIYNSDKVLEISGYAHMYVVCIDKKVVGCGAISSFWGKQDESILLTIFVLPDLQGKGIGRIIIETLESDEYFLRAKRIEIPASITACEFYKKMGYDYKDEIRKLDDEGHYRLEKFR